MELSTAVEERYSRSYHVYATTASSLSAAVLPMLTILGDKDQIELVQGSITRSAKTTHHVVYDEFPFSHECYYFGETGTTLENLE